MSFSFTLVLQCGKYCKTGKGLRVLLERECGPVLIMILPGVFMFVALEGLIMNWDFYWVLYECVSLKICSVQEMTKTSLE